MSAAASKINPDDIMYWWNDLEGTMTHGTNEDRRAVVRGFVKDVSIDPVASRWKSPSGDGNPVRTYQQVVAPRGTMEQCQLSAHVSAVLEQMAIPVSWPLLRSGTGWTVTTHT